MKAFILLLVASFALAREFNETYSREMVNFAAASFIGPDSSGNTENKQLAMQCFNKSYPNGGFEIVQRFKINDCALHYTDDCQFLIAKSEKMKMMVVAFRGTVGKDQFHNEMGDSLQDYIEWEGESYGKVNRYFSHALDTTWGYLSPYITNMSDYKIAFTGHSLGGALASLTALKARVYGIVQDNQITVYTFGEPRVGNAVLAGTFRTYITDMYRVVHNSDLVPHMPLCQGILTSKCKNDTGGKPYHQPQEIWYNSSNLLMSPGEYVSCDWYNGEDKSCSNQISVVTSLWNMATDRGADMHLHYYEHKLDEYGPKGCNSAVSIGVSFLTVTLLFLFNNLIRH